MSRPEIILARKMLLESKVWGITCERAITSGQWDDGSIMRDFIKRAEEYILRNGQDSPPIAPEMPSEAP